LFHQNLSSPFENKDNSTNGLKVFVREAYLNAALAAYILADFEEAVNISKKAVSVNPEDPKSLFFTAKYLARNNNKKEALEYLKKAIINAPYLCFATSEDGDLKAIPQALDFCNKFSIDFSIKIRAINIKIDELKYFINNSIVFELKKEIDEKNYLIKGCELLQMPLIDLHAEYHGKDPLFNKALQFLVNDLMSDDANSLPTVPKDEEGRRVYPVFDSWDRQKEVLNQMDYSYLAFYDELTDNAARETAIKEFFDDNLQLKLDGYFVKDLYDKWDEIKRIFEQKVQIQKEKELRKIDQENRKLIQKKQEEELSKPILDYYKKKNFTEAWKEIKKVRTSYPTNQYFVSLEKMINDNISGKLLSCWICVFLITFFTIGISDAFLLDNSVYQSIIIKLPLWLYKVLVILLLFGTSITLATYMTIKRSKIIRSTKD
jgi:tetratricopeptide (TPR) repeat protein